MIHCRNLTFRYPEAPDDSLRDITLDIRPGESLVIMGPNGSGKSTLALVLAGLLKPTSGEVSLSPRADNGSFPPVGMLFQNPDNQMVSVLVDKEIAFALENQGLSMTEMEPMVQQTMHSFGIERLARRLTSELSGGEKQRVALASLMVYRPPILVLDEPDSYLDVVGRRILREELDRLHGEQPEIVEIRITQYPGVARRYRRLLVLDQGCVIADAAPDIALARSGVLDRSVSSTRHLTLPVHAPSHMTSQSRITLSNVSFAFESNQPILDRVSCEIASGTVTCLVGPTGSGKSTLGLLLAGILQPDSGTITIGGPDGAPIDPADRIGMVTAVLQQPERQFFLSTCADEIAFGPANKGRRLGRSEIDAYLELVGLPAERFRGRDPLTLSMGEKRRLAFAVVLALGSLYVVFDEPTAGLDPEGVERFIQLVRASVERGLGIVIITHELPIIRELADRVYVLSDAGLRVVSGERFLEDPQLRDSVSTAFEQ